VVKVSETCRVKAEVRNPETGEVRTAELDCSVLPDKELDCVLLGRGASKTRCDTKHKKRETALPLTISNQKIRFTELVAIVLILGSLSRMSIESAGSRRCSKNVEI
jgi:hypothetical protein